MRASILFIMTIFSFASIASDEFKCTQHDLAINMLVRSNNHEFRSAVVKMPLATQDKNGSDMYESVLSIIMNKSADGTYKVESELLIKTGYYPSLNPKRESIHQKKGATLFSYETGILNAEGLKLDSRDTGEYVSFYIPTQFFDYSARPSLIYSQGEYPALDESIEENERLLKVVCKKK